STHDYILFFSNRGRVYKLKVYEVPKGSRTSRGRAVINLLPLASDEKIEAVINVKNFEGDRFLMMATKRGLAKKTPLEAYKSIRKNGIIAINLRDDDMLFEVQLTNGKRDIILATKNGKAIRFNEQDVRPMGRGATGVRGVRISEDDEVLAMEPVEGSEDLFIITEFGYGKRTSLKYFPLQKRGGKGVIAFKKGRNRGHIVTIKPVAKSNELILVSKDGVVIRISAKSVSCMGRNTSGVRVMRLRKGDLVSDITKIVQEESKEKEKDKKGETLRDN
ncbi:MAG: DNA gyrase subunit A, partial [Actinomycetia bacterium]|nr:DNA gyrase subunit A [Actinomycetes bacterium]